MKLIPKQTALSPQYADRFRRWILIARCEHGFTLIEMMVVVALMGITMAMFAVTYSTTINRSSQVQAQNIMQTEIRASLDQMVSDLRDATTGGTTPPIIAADQNSISFYSPDRMTANVLHNLRKIRYWFDGNVLWRQVTAVTTQDAQGNPIDPGNTGAIERIATIQAPLTGDPNDGGWFAGQIFKYCVQSPPDMTVDLHNETSPELITWSCQAPTTNDQIKTIVVRAVVSAVSRAEKFNYGSVATLRWNAS